MQGANNGWVRVYIYRGCVGISALGSSERVCYTCNAEVWSCLFSVSGGPCLLQTLQEGWGEKQRWWRDILGLWAMFKLKTMLFTLSHHIERTLRPGNVLTLHPDLIRDTEMVPTPMCYILNHFRAINFQKKIDSLHHTNWRFRCRTFLWHFWFHPARLILYNKNSVIQWWQEFGSDTCAEIWWSQDKESERRNGFDVVEGDSLRHDTSRCSCVSC